MYLLLFQVLCSLLLRPVIGFPHARHAIAKSARGDDLISGSDFLSVFIGATVPRPRPAGKRRLDSVTSEESNEKYTDSELDSEIDSYTTQNDPENTKQESPTDSSSPTSQQDNSQVDNHQYIERKTLPEVSTHLANELDSVNNVGSQKSTDHNDVLVRHVDVEPIGESSIANNRRIEYLTDSDIDKTESKLDIIEKTPTSTLSALENVPSFSKRNSSAPTLGIESISTSFLINSEPVASIPSDVNENEPINPDGYEDYNKKDITVSPVPKPSTESLEDNTQKPQNETHQVISVRVSSSVARSSPQHINKSENEKKQDVFSSLLDAITVNSEIKEDLNPSLEGISLVTEEQPAATSIQRSQLSVEESSPSSLTSVRQESSSNIQSRHLAGSIESPSNLQPPPVSYRTSVSTATSDSRVQFYSEPPSYQRVPSSVAETAQRAVIVQHPQPQQHQSFSQSTSIFRQSESIRTSSDHLNSGSDYDSKHQSSYLTNEPQKNQDFNSQNEHTYQAEGSRAQKSYEATHQEPQERSYGLPEHNYGTRERSYAKPEQNYEIDESVSVVSNGRAHGIQYQPVTTPGHADDTGLRDFSTQPGETRDPNSKFGYVVEGRNFRKYRVEERTPDGFIVGEYGVVSHDDGSLRGVRYTADGTINPRLIYDALLKFLSL
ncbi:hypothetical protein L9F63_012733 [Diploptera punctata]|uniref:Uncharacterized protein n=1 Tax=Diploptera punctata TaxID=6984 RepID=A0AAD8ADS5_DIPPU|nr:hypothetical protein L9F63_012733 [Diploptera punctata]